MKQGDFVTAAKATHRNFPGLVNFILWLLLVGTGSDTADAASAGPW